MLATCVVPDVPQLARTLLRPIPHLRLPRAPKERNASGVLMRWVGFELGGIQPSLDSAIAASGLQLGLTGFAAHATCGAEQLAA